MYGFIEKSNLLHRKVLHKKMGPISGFPDQKSVPNQDFLSRIRTRSGKPDNGTIPVNLSCRERKGKGRGRVSLKCADKKGKEE